ncbi:endolytic transglycosylase MltG [Peredibacter starrii]|uniref:Endolytic murein transglycosylase n=1 Tax=Peredibacter starrii TaxID=28202 RepID=A0AAX4HN58_9BACT|nr:endolytic transglycosylase MltG [Peredibacter starrii]WPU64607.1 endolytic transglycosylase MltG [Peredibacter starrii]
MLKKTLFATLVAAPLLALIMLSVVVAFIFNQSYTGPDKTFTVKSGETFGRINRRLYDEGLIPNTRVFHYYAKYKGLMSKFRAGNFTITTGSNMGQVLDTLVYGQPNLTSVTIPEGKNMYEIARIFANAGITTETEFLDAVKHPGLITQLSAQAQNLEGYLYPETYRFAPNTSAKTVVKAMIDLFNERTKNIDFNHPFLNKHQVITLASVVEKETGAKVERPAIAGVFTNRLKKRMRLQSDPTTIYGIWSRYQGNIKKADLLEMTPYNTYKIPALPQGPISNPSLEAIQAVLNPAQHDFLYFVSKNDGTHVFSKTYQDHEKAVQSFQRNSKAREGKSWRNLKQ